MHAYSQKSTIQADNRQIDDTDTATAKQILNEQLNIEVISEAVGSGHSSKQAKYKTGQKDYVHLCLSSRQRHSFYTIVQGLAGETSQLPTILTEEAIWQRRTAVMS